MPLAGTIPILQAPRTQLLRECPSACTSKNSILSIAPMM
jgi:hypothetical protein